jgi:hypothetical protein
MNESPFVVVRYAPGSAGRFISVVLQLSDAIAPWNTLFDKNKFSNKDYTNYLINSFPEDPTKHLRVEPDLPYYSDFYSGTYTRGEDVSFEQYCQYQKQAECEYFFKNLDQQQHVNLILHKSKIPLFMQGSHMVNIIIDTPAALELSQKLLWCKHYQAVNKTQVKMLAHDAETCNQKRSHLVQKFYTGSSTVVVDSLEDFYNNEIVKNPTFELFQNSLLLLEHDSNKCCNQSYFYLSSIFNKTHLIENINTICSQINVPQPDEQLLALTFDIWWNSQHKILKQYNL